MTDAHSHAATQAGARRHSDHGHGGHMQLAYHPGLPLTNGKLFMWLFLSTEIMFFAGLIGTYIVLRFGAPTGRCRADVHLSEPIGAFNTFVLICSSVTIVLGLEAARANKAALAKGWMVLTLALGSVFLGVKMYEYNAKFSHGIYPEAAQPDLRKGRSELWLAAVRLRLERSMPVEPRRRRRRPTVEKAEAACERGRRRSASWRIRRETGDRGSERADDIMTPTTLPRRETNLGKAARPWKSWPTGSCRCR